MYKRHCATPRSGWQSRPGITWWGVGFNRQPGCIKLTALFVLQPSYCKILKRFSALPSFIEEYLQNKCSSHWSCYWPHGGRGCLEEKERECVCLCGAETDWCVNTHTVKGRAQGPWGVCKWALSSLQTLTSWLTPHHRTRPSQSTLTQPYICPRAQRGLEKTNREESLREKQTRWSHGSMPDKKRKRSDGGRMGRAKWIQRKKVIGKSSCVPLEVEHRRWLGLAGGSVQEVLRGTYSGLDKGFIRQTALSLSLSLSMPLGLAWATPVENY